MKDLIFRATSVLVLLFAVLVVNPVSFVLPNDGPIQGGDTGGPSGGTRGR